MPPEEADSTDGTAKPRQLAEPEECPGGAKIKPPFEMGVRDLDEKVKEKTISRKNEYSRNKRIIKNIWRW